MDEGKSRNATNGFVKKCKQNINVSVGHMRQTALCREVRALPKYNSSQYRTTKANRMTTGELYLSNAHISLHKAV